MRIKVDQIPESGLDVAFSPQADHFAVLRQMAEQGQAGFAVAVDVTVHEQRIGQMIKADALLHTCAQLTCSRCLAVFSHPIEARFTLTFKPRPVPQTPEAAPRVEDPDAQADLFFFDGKEVDLTDGVQEQIVLALPMQPLCNPACKGLCPGCGGDLNTQACACPPAGSNSPFAALKTIAPKKNK